MEMMLHGYSTDVDNDVCDYRMRVMLHSYGTDIDDDVCDTEWGETE